MSVRFVCINFWKNSAVSSNWCHPAIPQSALAVLGEFLGKLRTRPSMREDLHGGVGAGSRPVISSRSDSFPVEPYLLTYRESLWVQKPALFFSVTMP
jgi:hypothetical protein